MLTAGTATVGAGTRQTLSPACSRSSVRNRLQGGFLGSSQSHIPARSRSPAYRRPSPAPVQALLGFNKKAAPKAARQTVIPEPSFNIPLVLGGLSALSIYEGNTVAAGLTGILGAFLAIQASRVKFVFDDKTLQVLIGEEKEESEISFVGGENKWTFDSFVNWEFWWPSFPVLVYFKETQTKPEGQIHFFPIIFNGKELYDVMVERCGSTQNSGPK